MKLFIDIETLPTTDAAAIEAIASRITAPANYKKAESIAEWERENKPQAVNDAVAKTSFDGLYGRICCICYAIDDGEVFTVHGDDERALLERFYSHVYDLSTTEHHGYLSDDAVTVIGHNIAGFDLPFLKHRSIIHGVRPPAAMLKAMNARPWDNCIADTMLMWSSDREKRVGMDKLCLALGMDGKGDFDGSMVAATWPIDPQKVADYCKADVERTRALYRRMSFDQLAPPAQETITLGYIPAGTVVTQDTLSSMASEIVSGAAEVNQISREGKMVPSDETLIDDFLALLSISATEKKSMRVTLQKFIKYQFARSLKDAA
jgi:hypothetical protein